MSFHSQFKGLVIWWETNTDLWASGISQWITRSKYYTILLLTYYLSLLTNFSGWNFGISLILSVNVVRQCINQNNALYLQCCLENIINTKILISITKWVLLVEQNFSWDTNYNTFKWNIQYIHGFIMWHFHTTVSRMPRLSVHFVSNSLA